MCVLLDEVESLTRARSAAVSGSEPADAIRAVNALLTQVCAWLLGPLNLHQGGTACLLATALLCCRPRYLSFCSHSAWPDI